MKAPLAVSKPGKAFLNQAAHTIMAILQKSPSLRATAEIIFVKNQTSVVSFNLVSPDHDASSEDSDHTTHTCGFSLDDKGGIEGELAGLHCIQVV